MIWHSGLSRDSFGELWEAAEANLLSSVLQVEAGIYADEALLDAFIDASVDGGGDVVPIADYTGPCIHCPDGVITHVVVDAETGEPIEILFK